MKEKKSLIVELPNNKALAILVGPQDSYIRRMEDHLHVEIALRGNKISISGDVALLEPVRAMLLKLYEGVIATGELTLGTVNTALRLIDKPVEGGQYDAPTIATQKRMISPRSEHQAHYMKSMIEKDMVFGVGPAGTGKTYLAAAFGISLLLEGKVQRVILSRPAVEAGEKLGFLPGDMREKVDPYLRPLYDALNDMLPGDQIEKRLASGEIEVAPLAFMRGRTLANAFVILDEAQNTTPVQMKMFLTRLGDHSKMVINGDLSQVDLPKGVPSGLADALDHLSNISDIGIIRFTDEDVVRHALVSKIVRAYASSN